MGSLAGKVCSSAASSRRSIGSTGEGGVASWFMPRQGERPHLRSAYGAGGIYYGCCGAAAPGVRLVLIPCEGVIHDRRGSEAPPCRATEDPVRPGRRGEARPRRRAEYLARGSLRAL